MRRAVWLLFLLGTLPGAARGQSAALDLRPLPPRPAASPMNEQESAEHRRAFTAALDDRRFDAALEAASSWTGRTAAPGVLDEVSYRLVEAGAEAQAAALLLQRFPFEGRPAGERDTLLQRLSLLLVDRRVTMDPSALAPLRVPMDGPGLRGRQATLWSGLGDCGAVRVVLGDLSPEYGFDDWMRLGDCATPGDRVLARDAYARAHRLRPGGRASRGLGYEAYALGDFDTGLAAWQAVDMARASDDDVLAAVTTALAAQDGEQARNWLTLYENRGFAENARYWSLVGQQASVAEPAAATAALKRAVALRPDVDDYLRLSRLEPDGGERIVWLEQAAALAPDDGDLQLQLAYAYRQAGRPGPSLAALERAAALRPGDARVQAELGFIYWREQRPASAAAAFRRAQQVEPDNPVLNMQLVYAYQRLGRNEEARQYVERVLDGPSLGDDRLTSLAVADRRFGLQRLHEDLDRRVTVNLDGWTGRRVSAGSGSTVAGAEYNSYSQIEADLRLGRTPIRNGRTVSAYARVLSDGGSTSAAPTQNPLLGVGLRWKPWTSQVVYLAAEGQANVEDGSRQDVMLRASGSFFNAGRYSDDWHPGHAGWLARNLYLDAAYYVRSELTAAAADYRVSYHRRVAGSSTIEPYVHLQASGIGTRDLQEDVRAGAGLRWNLWYGGNRYDAPPHKLSIGLEYQQAFTTYLDDRHGVFLALNSRW